MKYFNSDSLFFLGVYNEDAFLPIHNLWYKKQNKQKNLKAIEIILEWMAFFVTLL